METDFLCTVFEKIYFQIVFEVPIPWVSELWIYLYWIKDNMKLRTVLELCEKSDIVTKWSRSITIINYSRTNAFGCKGVAEN